MQYKSDTQNAWIEHLLSSSQHTDLLSHDPATPHRMCVEVHRAVAGHTLEHVSSEADVELPGLQEAIQRGFWISKRLHRICQCMIMSLDYKLRKNKRQDPLHVAC